EGCLEIQVEAMTIEPTTQRESHKISMHRSIVPAELAQTDPTGLLEAFEPWTPPPPRRRPKFTGVPNRIIWVGWGGLAAQPN
ncbi:MAG: hypothetical protein VKJ85_00060, partial [Prochlorothrix sp.]|nr:hypothetical protein [Prochlorothrix sp.]